MAAVIRLAGREDAAAIAAIYAPIVASTPISFETQPPDEAEIARRVESVAPVYPWLVCEQGGAIAGYAYASRHRTRAAYRWAADVSAYVHPDFRRRGVGRGLYRSLLAILEAQGYTNACAGITLPNPGSVGLHESLGFTPVGVYQRVGYKLGQWHDVGWWERPLRAPGDAGEPPEPLRLAELEQASSWDTLLAAGLSCIRNA